MSVYVGGMRETIARIVIMLAVLIMPFGMTPATAAVHHSMLVNASMQHCPEEGSSHHQSKGDLGACTMACASALPAVDIARAEPIPPADVPVVAIVENGLDGLHPETATPPPKIA